MLHELQDVRNRLARLTQGAVQFFDAAIVSSSRIGGDELIQSEDYEFYWRRLPAEQQQESIELQKALLKAIGELTSYSRRSPLLSDADERELSENAKCMRAALRLRMYRSWGSEVIHDEGRVLGVQSPGQNDREPCGPDSAKRVFMDSSHSLMNVLELIEAAPTFDREPRMSEGAVAKIRANTVFVMMWIDPSKPELEDVYSTIKRCCSDFDLKAVRADEIEHEEVITERILSEIKTSEFLIADLTGARPSVYYEVGYAHAIGRRVAMYRKSGEKIHFDLAAYNCPEYTNNTELHRKLTKRLQDLTNRQGRGG